MKYIIAIALMFAVSTTVFANSDVSTSVSTGGKVNTSSSISASNGNSTDSPSEPSNSSHSGGGSRAKSIQDKIFALTGYRFEKTNDPRMIEIYTTLYQILITMKSMV